jgi:hypothetical protein
MATARCQQEELKGIPCDYEKLNEQIQRCALTRDADMGKCDSGFNAEIQLCNKPGRFKDIKP